MIIKPYNDDMDAHKFLIEHVLFSVGPKILDYRAILMMMRTFKPLQK